MMMALNPSFGRTLKIGGAGALTQLLRQVAPAFKDDTGITLEVIPGLGSSGANNALVDGKLGIAVAGRDLRETEIARGLRVAASFRTPFGFATSRPGPDGLKSTEIAALHRADKATWPDGMPVIFTVRPVDESDTIVLVGSFPGMAEALRHMRKRRDLPVATTDQENANIAEKVNGSLIAVSLVQILIEKRNLRLVSIDGVAASLETYESGAYPYAKPLHLVTPSTMSPEAEAFLAFLAKPATIALLRRSAVVVVK